MQQEFRIMIRFFYIVFLNTKILGHGKSNQNLTQCVSSFYDRCYCLLEEVGRGLSKNCLFQHSKESTEYIILYYFTRSSQENDCFDIPFSYLSKER